MTMLRLDVAYNAYNLLYPLWGHLNDFTHTKSHPIIHIIEYVPLFINPFHNKYAVNLKLRSLLTASYLL